jgi:hypothetical protein
MGLDTTHDCWHGPYSSFGRWRKDIAAMIGINLDEMLGFYNRATGVSGGTPFPDPHTEPLVILIDHSDCDGEIDAADCAAIADRLADLLPRMAPDAEPYGHRWATERWIAGLRRAAAAGENVLFH